MNWWNYSFDSRLPVFVDFRLSILLSHLQSFNGIKTILLMRRIFSSVLLLVVFLLLPCHKPYSVTVAGGLGVVVWIWSPHYSEGLVGRFF